MTPERAMPANAWLVGGVETALRATRAKCDQLLPNADLKWNAIIQVPVIPWHNLGYGNMCAIVSLRNVYVVLVHLTAHVKSIKIRIVVINIEQCYNSV